MYDVFISYSSENQEQAERMRSVLEQNGFSCWYAPLALRGNQDFTQEIPAAIRASRAFLLLMSRGAQSSKWVKRELGEADECDLPIYTFFLEDCPLTDKFRFVLRFNQHYAASLGYEEQLRRLLQDLQEGACREATPSVAMPSTQSSKKPAKGKLLAVVAALAVIAGVATAVLLLTGGHKDGKYVVWNPAYSMALADEEVHGYYLAGEEVQSKGDELTGYTRKCVWTLDFNRDNTFTMGRDGVLLGVKPGYNGIGLGGDYTATVWELSEADDGLYHICNVETGYYLEWYAAKNNWNIHNDITETNREQFLLRLEAAK